MKRLATGIAITAATYLATRLAIYLVRGDRPDDDLLDYGSVALAVAVGTKAARRS